MVPVHSASELLIVYSCTLLTLYWLATGVYSKNRELECALDAYSVTCCNESYNC